MRLATFLCGITCIKRKWSSFQRPTQPFLTEKHKRKDWHLLANTNIYQPKTERNLSSLMNVSNICFISQTSKMKLYGVPKKVTFPL